LNVCRPFYLTIIPFRVYNIWEGSEVMFSSILGLVNSPLTILAVLVAFISSLFLTMSFHEFAHAHAAVKEGDLTPKILKRYTLAPFAHIDTAGLLLLLFFNIGFAKPVPVDSRNFKRGKRSELRVALAGVSVNVLIGIIATFLYVLLENIWPALFSDYGFISLLYTLFFEYMISLNFMFAFFNILPIYPLDGFRIVEAFSKTKNGYIRFMRSFSFWIILLLLFTGILELYIGFFAGGLSGLIRDAFNALFSIF